MVLIGREYISVDYVKWERKCKRCGFIETVHKEPQELIDKREEVNKQKEIKRLEKMLKNLRVIRFNYLFVFSSFKTKEFSL